MTETGLPVTILRPGDSDRMAALHGQAFPKDEAWSSQAFAASLEQASTLALGHERGGELAALILVQRAGPDAEILTLAVSPAQRRGGIARELVRAAMRLLGPYGVDRLLLDVAEDNDAAIGLYDGLGFAVDGRRRGYYRRRTGRPADAILMSRPISGHRGETKA